MLERRTKARREDHRVHALLAPVGPHHAGRREPLEQSARRAARRARGPRAPAAPSPRRRASEADRVRSLLDGAIARRGLLEQIAAVHVVGEEVRRLARGPRRRAPPPRARRGSARRSCRRPPRSRVCPANAVGPAYVAECSSTPRYASWPGSIGITGAAHVPVALTTARACSSPVLVSSRKPAPSRCTPCTCTGRSHRQRVAALVLREVADGRVARRIAVGRVVHVARHQPARERRPLRRREEPQRRPGVPPCATRLRLVVEQHEAERVRRR